MSLAVELAVAKTHKFATRESGDTVEFVERPSGGFSVVIVDGQGSGAAAKRLSLMVAARAVALLGEGVRDGAVARAAHDVLFVARGGQVSAALDIVSIDFVTNSIRFARNSGVPLLLRREGRLELVPASGERIGIYRRTRPLMLEYPAVAGVRAIVVTDGVVAAGARTGRGFNLLAATESAISRPESAQQIADRLLTASLEADQGRPADDMAVVVVRLDESGTEDAPRRMALSAPAN